jgi:hypothetical protein
MCLTSEIFRHIVGRERDNIQKRIKGLPLHVVVEHLSSPKASRGL